MDLLFVPAAALLYAVIVAMVFGCDQLGTRP